VKSYKIWLCVAGGLKLGVWVEGGVPIVPEKHAQVEDLDRKRQITGPQKGEQTKREGEVSELCCSATRLRYLRIMNVRG
jgi:hypothetical protein